jgi:hypothetical protein
MDPKKMPNERIQLLNSIPFENESWSTAEEWLPRWVRQVISQGETPAFGLPDSLLNSDKTVEEYLGI